MVSVFATIGFAFGSIAALMAFLITYGEYSHHYPDTSEPRRIALQTAIATFLFFIFTSLVLGYILTLMVVG